MVSRTAARRYAKGLLQLSVESGTAETFLTELQGIRSTVEGSAEFARLLASPVVKNDKKIAVVHAVFPSASPLMGNLVGLLGSRSKLDLLPDIAAAYEAQYNHHIGLVEANAVSAFALDSATVDALRVALEKQTGRTVRLTTAVDPTLMGGLTVRIGDTIIDGSVSHALERMEILFQS